MRAGCSGSAGPACPCRTIPSRRRFAVRANSSAQPVCVRARARALPVLGVAEVPSTGCVRIQVRHLQEDWRECRMREGAMQALLPSAVLAGGMGEGAPTHRGGWSDPPRTRPRRAAKTLCDGRVRRSTQGIDRQWSAGARCCVGVVVLTHMWSARRLHSRSGPGPPRAPGAARGGHEQEQVSQHSMRAAVLQAA